MKMDGNVVIIQLLFGRIQPMLVAVITFVRHDLKPRFTLAELTYQGSPDTFKSFKGMTNVNCHYGPPGNKGILPFGIGRKPFRLGEPCTDCNSGHGWCDNGLCIDCPDKNCDCPIKVKMLMIHKL